MAVIHYLNVKQGDCSIIQHNTGHVSVIDVCNASADTPRARLLEQMEKAARQRPSGNYQQKHHPVNPILYLKEHGVSSVFRFILTHPDMDHMDGIEAFFREFKPTNFWDTDNTCEKDFEEGSPYNPDDWEFYKRLRDGRPESDPKRLVLYSGARGQYYNVGQDGKRGGDGISILAPTRELVSDSNDCDDFNDCSYVLLYRVGGFRVVFGGDSHDATWEHILDAHGGDLKEIDLLIAPHHGRKSDRCYDFLDVLKPKVTFFGNANCEHLAYSAWSYRQLPYLTNNQAGSMVVDLDGGTMDLYVTNQTFAAACNPATFYSDRLRAHYDCPISQAVL